jgi:hypothetical protein
VQAADETMLRVSATGHIAIVFADGTQAELLPVVQGLRWAYSDCSTAEPVKGTGTDLFNDGLTVTIPVTGAEPGALTVFGKWAVDPQDPAVVTFKYRFTAPKATKLNAARLTINLPIKPYVGMHLESVEGPTTPTAMPEQPTDGGHLLNAMAKGAEISADKSKHGLRAVLDSPAWCIVDDERHWTGMDRYSIGLHAVCAADGTAIEAGQSFELNGSLGFDAPVKVVEDTLYARAPAAMVAAGLVPDMADPCSPTLRDKNGAEVATFETWLWGARRQRTTERPDPGATAFAPPPGPVSTKTHLWADSRNSAGFQLAQELTTPQGQLHLAGKLVADAAFEMRGLEAMVSLSWAHFDGCKLTVLAPKPVEVTLSRAGPEQPVLKCPDASGVRIERAGVVVLEIRGDKPRRWDVWPQGRKQFIVHEWIEELPTGDETRKVSAGARYDHELTCTWGAQ